MKRFLLILLGAASLCGGAFVVGGCAGGYVGVDSGPYYDNGPYIYGGGWWHEGGWHQGGWAHPGFHRR
ncbi:MAG TPA: hypothetical protein VGL42_10135 [Opitutaceae bacterium]|jgi:hypothetical protein